MTSSADEIDCEYLIVGAGCSGLSLAVHLLDAGVGERIHIVDAKPAFADDRTWCAWDHREPSHSVHPFREAVSHHWERWRVGDRRHRIVRGSVAHPYEHIAARDFYRIATARVAQASNVKLELGSPVRELREQEGYVSATTATRQLRAETVFDSRPPKRWGEGWLQHFQGWFVRTQKPRFDPEVATLMDFAVDQDRGLHFMYVLPFSPTEALVEDTYFSDAPFESEVYEAALRAYLHALGVRHYEIVAREAGVLPMTLRQPPARVSDHVCRIGLAGGMAKPSSGYAFGAIQRFSRDLAQLLKNRGPNAPLVLPRARPPRTAALDQIFLSYLMGQPSQAPKLFMRLFERVPPEQLTRFLSETGSAQDDLAVIAHLRHLPLAAAAARLALSNARPILARSTPRL